MTTLYLTKRFTNGTLAGLRINDTLTFVSVDRAASWLSAIRAKGSAKVGYEVVDYSFQKYWRY